MAHVRGALVFGLAFAGALGVGFLCAAVGWPDRLSYDLISRGMLVGAILGAVYGLFLLAQRPSHDAVFKRDGVLFTREKVKRFVRWDEIESVETGMLQLRVRARGEEFGVRSFDLSAAEYGIGCARLVEFVKMGPFRRWCLRYRWGAAFVFVCAVAGIKSPVLPQVFLLLIPVSVGVVAFGTLGPLQFRDSPASTIPLDFGYLEPGVRYSDGKAEYQVVGNLLVVKHEGWTYQFRRRPTASLWREGAVYVHGTGRNRVAYCRKRLKRAD